LSSSITAANIIAVTIVTTVTTIIRSCMRGITNTWDATLDDEVK
jgi:hypothetical protein